MTWDRGVGVGGGVGLSWIYVSAHFCFSGMGGKGWSITHRNL